MLCVIGQRSPLAQYELKMTGGFHGQITFMNLLDRLVRCVDWARTGVQFPLW